MVDPVTNNPGTRPSALIMFVAVLAAVILVSMVGCGGASSDLGNVSVNLSADIAGKGIFRDSTVSGLTYVTPTKTGVTGADGIFDFQQNETITFSLGGVTLGDAKAKAVMTPIDFATDRSSDSLDAKNIARFLMMLDADGNPDNGIVIPQLVQDIATNWPQVDFSTTDLDTELANIISDVNSVDGSPVTHTLPDDVTAKTHLETTLLCTYGGAFQGQFAGDDSGHFGFVIEANVNRPSAGLLSGFVFSNVAQLILPVNGTTPMTFESAINFAQPNGSASNGRNINMRYTSLDLVDGNWSDFQGTGFGTFSGGRIGGGQISKWYFAGKFVPDPEHPEWDSGILAFNLLGPDSDSISGDIFSMNDATQYGLSGLLNGGTDISDSTSSSDGKRWTGNAIIINPSSVAYGVMSGTWTDTSKGQNGTFTGTGCLRN